MLRRLAALIVLGVLGAALASWLAAQPGTMQLDWFGWRLEMPTSLAAGALVIAALLLLFFDRVIRGILRFPAWLGRTVEQRRDASGHKALTLGLMAVSAGEAREAKKQAARAQRLLQAPQLTDLLSAQAAHLAGDHQAAGRYFKSLTNDSDTAFLGYIGLTRLAMDADNRGQALSAARLAFSLKPKSNMAAQQVLLLEADSRNWVPASNAANFLLADATNSKKDTRQLRRQKTALFYLIAEEQLASQDAETKTSKEAIKALETALAADRGFLPAIAALADIHLAAGARRKATKILEAGFKTCPDVAIVDRLKAAWNLNDGAYIARLIKLVDQVSADNDALATAHYIAATEAFAVGLLGEAHGQLDAIDEQDRDSAAWRLVAQIAEKEEDTATAAMALHRASDAPRSPSWQCDNCHSLQAMWVSHCPDCDMFGTLEWRRPGHVTPLKKLQTEDNAQSGKIGVN